jgi:hypothetical protein
MDLALIFLTILPCIYPALIWCCCTTTCYYYRDRFSTTQFTNGTNVTNGSQITWEERAGDWLIGVPGDGIPGTKGLYTTASNALLISGIEIEGLNEYSLFFGHTSKTNGSISNPTGNVLQPGDLVRFVFNYLDDNNYYYVEANHTTSGDASFGHFYKKIAGVVSGPLEETNDPAAEPYPYAEAVLGANSVGSNLALSYTDNNKLNVVFNGSGSYQRQIVLYEEPILGRKFGIGTGVITGKFFVYEIAVRKLQANPGGCDFVFQSCTTASVGRNMPSAVQIDLSAGNIQAAWNTTDYTCDNSKLNKVLILDRYDHAFFVNADKIYINNKCTYAFTTPIICDNNSFGFDYLYKFWFTINRQNPTRVYDSQYENSGKDYPKPDRDDLRLLVWGGYSNGSSSVQAQAAYSLIKENVFTNDDWIYPRSTYDITQMNETLSFDAVWIKCYFYFINGITTDCLAEPRPDNNPGTAWPQTINIQAL